MDFVRNNLLLIAVAVVSGAMLVWPFVRRGFGGPWVSTGQATHLINREDALLLDVRESAEFGAGHALGAKSVPIAQIEARAGADLAKRKDKPLIVYCDGGERAARAAASLRKLGFSRVLNLSGGLPAWQQAGLPVER